MKKLLFIILINAAGLAIIITGSLIAAYILLYLSYFAIVISLFHPKLILVFGLTAAALIFFSVAKAIYKPNKVYRLKVK